MKTTKIALVGGLAGLAWITISTVRWFFLYPDMSQFVLSVAIGVIMLAGSYAYNWMKSIDEALAKHEKRVDGIVEWYIKEDLKV